MVRSEEPMNDAEAKTDQLIRSTYQSIRSQTGRSFVRVVDIRERTALPPAILDRWIRLNGVNGVKLTEIAERKFIEISDMILMPSPVPATELQPF